jgi:hypothetical protein
MFSPQPRTSHPQPDKRELQQIAGDLRLIYSAPIDASFDDLLRRIGRAPGSQGRA